MPEVSSNRLGDKLSDHVTRRIPKVSSMLTRSIEIVVGGSVIGYIQNFNPNEGREVTDVREIGNEDIVELAPGGLTNNTISVNRMMLNYSKIQQVMDDFGGQHGNAVDGMRSLMDFNYPFDIIVLARRHNDTVNGDPLDDNVPVPTELQSGLDKSPVIILDWYHECWFQTVSYALTQGAQFTIVENSTVKYTWRTGSFMYASKGNTNNGYYTQNYTRTIGS